MTTPASPEPEVNFEKQEADRLRRDVCLRLATRYMKTGSTNEQQAQELLVSIGVDFFSNPLPVIYDHIDAKPASPTHNPNRLKTAVDLMYFYYHNPELSIPEDVVYTMTLEYNPDQQLPVNQKVLLVIDEVNFANRPRKNTRDEIVFKDRAPDLCQLVFQPKCHCEERVFERRGNLPKFGLNDFPI